ncbi:MAG: aspartate aminotransferase family protein [Gammaproteobacteria bacterium]|nr:aspartate aminotransferase family protein [Gammaproteobacteria bacterium]
MPDWAAKPSSADLEAHWMPFSANRYYKEHPVMVTAAEGCYYTTNDNKTLFDALSGLWCCGAGHGRREIADAIAKQATQLDYAPGFNVGHPLGFELATRLTKLAPTGLDYALFTSSGSESADTSLKMARAYWRMRGQPQRTKLIGRARGYHGVNIGGTSVGGINGNRKQFGQILDADHLPHTLLQENAFSRGQPEHGAHLANHLEELIELHDASNIAAVIVEPFSGSAGVIVPPQGYLQRLRDICDQHGILLIFDEVITGFCRTGNFFGADTFGVTPDIMNLAKGLTNGTVPMGAVLAKKEIYQAFMAADLPRHGIEFAHGYTYSAHPLACAAALATLELYQSDDSIGQVRALSGYFEEGIHSLKGLPQVEDIRNIGLAGAIQLAARDGDPTIRPFEVFRRCWDKGCLVRAGGNTIQLAPPFIATKSEIDFLFNRLQDVLSELK